MYQLRMDGCVVNEPIGKLPDALRQARMMSALHGARVEILDLDEDGETVLSFDMTMPGGR